MSWPPSGLPFSLSRTASLLNTWCFGCVDPASQIILQTKVPDRLNVLMHVISWDVEVMLSALLQAHAVSVSA